MGYSHFSVSVLTDFYCSIKFIHNVVAYLSVLAEFFVGHNFSLGEIFCWAGLFVGRKFRDAKPIAVFQLSVLLLFIHDWSTVNLLYNGQ